MPIKKLEMKKDRSAIFSEFFSLFFYSETNLTLYIGKRDFLF